MKKILIVQRKLMHYRQLLFSYMQSQGEYDIDVVEMGFERKTSENIRTFPSHALSFNWHGKKYSLSRSAELIRYVKQVSAEYDYIILEGLTNLANNLPMCRWLSRHHIPYIIWDAGRRNSAEMTFVRKLAQKPIEQIWEKASAIIAYSTLAKRYFQDIGIPEDKIFVCQNTLYVDEFDQQIRAVLPQEVARLRSDFAPNGEKTILYVGAIEARKRIKDLIVAYQRVRERGIGAALVIIGDGEQMADVKTFIEEREISGVFLMGSIVAGVIQYFLASDVFVLPSEGGLALNQAMICAKPVVASCADGTELDLIEPGKNGDLFEETNVEHLADCLSKILGDDGLRARMGRRSREIIETKVNEKRFYENFIRCLSSIHK